MQKWEYLYVVAGPKKRSKDWEFSWLDQNRDYYPTRVLSELGSQGWELVSVITTIDSSKEAFTTWAYTYVASESYYISNVPYRESRYMAIVKQNNTSLFVMEQSGILENF